MQGLLLGIYHPRSSQPFCCRTFPISASSTSSLPLNCSTPPFALALAAAGCVAARAGSLLSGSVAAAPCASGSTAVPPPRCNLCSSCARLSGALAAASSAPNSWKRQWPAAPDHEIGSRSGDAPGTPFYNTTRSAHVMEILQAPPTQRYFTGVVAEGVPGELR